MDQVNPMIRVNLDDIQLWQANYRQGDVQLIANSIRRFGYNRSVSLWRDYIVIAGNHTIKALRELQTQGEDAPKNVTVQDGAWWIDVHDVSHLDDKEAEAYAIADNRTADVAVNDDEQLASLLTQIQAYDADLFAATGWDDDDLHELMAGLMPTDPTDDPGAQIDRAEELNEQWQVQPGDLWVIGKHRLLCGDATCEADVERVMDGEIAQYGLTDPPYGVDMSKGFEGFGGFGPPIARRQYSDTWDESRPTQQTFSLFLKYCFRCVIFGGNFFADLLPQSTHWIVWDKLNTMPTYGDCELAWTNIPRKSVKKFTHQYNGLIGKEKERYHPTQKPLKLFTSILQEYTESENLVLDPFGGSGTTMVACEQLGRQCRMIEIEPKYCAVILERMAGMGLEPVKQVEKSETYKNA